MWFLILSIFILLCVNIYFAYFEDLEGKIFATMLTWVFGGLALSIIGYPILGLTTGLYADYSDGKREGYITKFSVQGIIFKTNEAQLQVGTGQMAAFQEPWAFSVPEKFVKTIESNLGKRVVIDYTQYLMMPWRYGETDCLVTNVTVVN